MTPQELKASILQLAIQGKLVPQIESEGNAEDLYREIQKEKQKLIAEKKIKKEKPLEPIKEEDIPFDIPQSWKWCRLREVVYNRGQMVPSSKFSYIDIGSIDNKRQCLSNEENLIEADKAPSRARKIVENGDIIYSTVRPYLHNMAIIDRDFSCPPIASTGFATMVCYEGVYNKFLFNYLLSPSFDNYANATDNSKGVAYPAINDEKLYKAIVPLPPLEEQKRIVAKIEELLPLVERYGKAYERLEEFNKKFPGDMKKSVLQMAIQGKLVEQRPEEGTAEELYELIQTERARLIKEGKIKKEKSLTVITDEEKPFDIPDSWKWVRLGELGSFVRGNGIKKDEVVPKGLPCVRYGQLYTTYRTKFSSTVSFVPKSIFDKCQKIENGDVVMALTGENNFDIALATAYLGIEQVAMGGDMTKFSSYQLMEPLFLVYALNSSYAILCKSKLATGQIIVHISNDKLASIPIPLPPLEEQKRIVAKLEEVLPLCDALIK